MTHMNMFKATTAKTPEEYIHMIEEPRKSQMKTLHECIQKAVPNLTPFIISGMIGYGKYQYKSKSGRQGEWAVVLLANQKQYISVYACGVKDGKYIPEQYKDALPKANIGKSCIRIKKLEDIDMDVLKTILVACEKKPHVSCLI
jgi:hypothetical protein